MLRFLAAAASLWLLISARLAVSAIPDGFEDRPVIVEGRGLLMPTDFCFTPQGQMLVVNKGGELIVFDDPNGDQSYPDSKEALNLAPYICTNGDRGVLGVAIHPDFTNNRFIFISYTYNKNGNCNEDIINGPVNRLSRFVLQESNDVDFASETVFFETSSLEYDHHNSGDIWFGSDGNMWVSVGDGGSTWSAVSANPGNLLGSMVRLTLDGDIPADNPFTPQSGENNSVRCNVTGVPPAGSPAGAKCQEIFAIGLRNPFRFAIDPNVQDKVRFHVNDVGQSNWEEISEGGTDFAGADYGWPAREGPCPINRDADCANAHSYDDPIHYYAHNNGGAATGAAFVPDGIWPEQYDGAYLYADFVYGKIYIMKDTGTSECRTCNPPVSGKEVTDLTEYYQIVNIGFGPFGNTQALYYTGVYDIRRVAYIGDGNRSPDAVILAEPTSGPVGMTVMFSGAGSNDPDGDGLGIAWDFDGDGVVDSTIPNTSYVYGTAGLYRATLKVSDGNGGSHTTSIDISVGNKPVPVITSPVPGSTFAAGDVITLSGTATDVENGQLDEMSLTWEVRQHHDTHYHPFLLPTEGNDIVLQPAPEPEDYSAATNSYLEIILTATDSDGLSDTVAIDLKPRLVLVEFDTEPSGLEINLDGTPLTTPANASTWENHNLRVNAFDQLFQGQAYVWSSWSNGEEQSHTIQIPPASGTTLKYIAQFSEFDGTFAPSAGLCMPGSLGIITNLSDLRSGQTFVNEEYKVYAEQRSDGNLVVRKGTPSEPGDLVWESGYVGVEGDYFTWVQGNSNMITFQGIPPDAIGNVVFETKTFGVDQDEQFFFGIDCSGTVVLIMQGTPDDPILANLVWQSAPFPPSDDTPGDASQPSSPPAPVAPAPCTPGSLGIVAWQWELSQGQVFINIDHDVYSEQRNDGNLVVRQGTPSDPGEIVWQSGYSGEVGEYFTRVLGNSDMITYKGTQPEEIEAEVWQTGTLDDEGLYFFGIDCNGTIIVAEGTPESPGDILWQGESLIAVTGAPSLPPGAIDAPTSSPSVLEDGSPLSPSAQPSATGSSDGTGSSPDSSAVASSVVVGMMFPLVIINWYIYNGENNM